MDENGLKIAIAGVDFRPGTGPSTYFSALQECLGDAHFLCHLTGCGPGETDLCHVVDAKRASVQMIESLRTPVVADFHDDYWSAFTPYPSPDLPVRFFRQRLLLAHHLEVIKNSTAVIAHSKSTAASIENVIQKKLADKVPVHVVPYGIRTERMEAETNTESASAPLVLFAGRDMFRKGFPLAVKALRSILRQKPGARLRVLGDEYFHTRVSGRLLSIGTAVEFLPSQSRDELARHFREASVLVLPSRQEAFGIVLVEAMAAGLPVVAARTGGIPEAVEDGMSGLLHRPGDAADLADKILSVLDDHGLRHKLVRGGLERSKRFSLSTMKESLEQAYYSAIKGTSV